MSRVTWFTFMVRTETTGWGRFYPHHWIRLRTPETELGVFYGDLGTFPAVFLATKSFFFFLEVGPSPSVFVATVTGF